MSISQLLPLSAGTFIKEYEIIELLGSGGFGAVYKAKPRNGSSVAIKETYFGDEQELKMFRDEAKLLSSLSDEDFPKVIDHFDNGNNRYYLIMELIEGDDLGDVLVKAGKPIELKTVLDWADKILESLAYLHSKGIVHRDIKPQNLKLTPKGRIKIIDLGIAKGYVSNEAAGTSYVGSVGAATPCYAPIEQHLRLEENFVLMLMMCSEQKTTDVLAQGTDPRADIYALGVTLYRLLTNTAPAISPNRALSVWSGKKDLAIPAHEVNKNIPLEISQFLHKAIEIERDNRYASAKEMREALWEAFTTIKNRHEQQQSAEFAKREKELAERERRLREKEEQFKEPQPTEDWRQIEAKRLRKEEEANRRQAEIDEIERKLNEPKKEDSEKIPVKRIVGTFAAVTLLFVGMLGIAYLTKPTPQGVSINSTKTTTSSVGNNAKNSVTNAVNNTANSTTNVAANSTLNADDYFNKGYDCSEKKDYDCAISNFSKAIELNPKDQIAYNNRGTAYYNKDKFDQAIQDYSKAIELKPDYANAYSNRGKAYKLKSNFDQSIKDYGKAIELKPDDASYYNSRGIAYDDKKDYDQAIKDYNKAIELKPDYANAYVGRGVAYYNKANYNAAIADYRKALEIDPNNKLAKDNLKLALAEKAKR